MKGMKLRKALGLFVTAAVAGSAAPAYADGRNGVDPVGTWLMEVVFPGGNPPPFREFVTLHRDGTLSESNGALHGSSANYFLNYNGSDGYGNWRRHPGGRIAWTFHKMVFCGPAFAPPFPGAPEGLSLGCTPQNVGQHIGYLRVRTVGQVLGNTFSSQSADSQVDLLIDLNPADGVDPAAPDVVIPFGGSDATGRRLGVQLPY